MMTVDGTATGFHHADDSDPVVGDAFDDDDGYYRFLTGHMSGYLYGVCGLEDDDWEATLSTTDHNEYLGYGGSTDSSGGFYNVGPTATAFFLHWLSRRLSYRETGWDLVPPSLGCRPD